jgi:hypothetical protein
MKEILSRSARLAFLAFLTLGLAGVSFADGAKMNPAADKAMNEAQAKARAKNKGQKRQLYTCPMHPEVTSDKPGKCPKCHMDLVKKGPKK